MGVRLQAASRSQVPPTIGRTSAAAYELSCCWRHSSCSAWPRATLRMENGHKGLRQSIPQSSRFRRITISPFCWSYTDVARLGQALGVVITGGRAAYEQRRLALNRGADSVSQPLHDL